jgi:ATP-binding cassette subfamily B protein
MGQRDAAHLRRADYYRTLGLAPDAAKETRVFGLAEWVSERFRSQWRAAMDTVWRERRKHTVRSWTAALPWGFLQALAFLLVGSAAVRGEISLTTMAVTAQACVWASYIWWNDDDYQVAYGAAAVPALLELERAAAERSAAMPGTRDPRGLPVREIRFEAVRFRYAGQERDVYESLELVIPADRSTAIVGANGSGKTTLVKLLSRLYDPCGGRITADGVDLRELDPRAWQRRIAAVFQDFVRFELSAAENVGFGHPEILGDRVALRAEADRSGATELIEALPAGWDTRLSRQYAGGVELSGGQWQRIALARVMLAVAGGASILVLDEPTASLDVRAEAALFDRFLELTQGVTTILISHRFSTVRHADRICVLEHGKVVELGTHDELMAKRGRYFTMFDLQAQRFATGGAVEGEEEMVFDVLA